MEELLKRQSVLLERLSEVGKKLHRESERLQWQTNGLHCKKRDLWEITRAFKNGKLSNYGNWRAYIKIIDLKKEIEWSRERLTEKERDQRKLKYYFKELNREYSKLEKRIARKQSKA